MMMKKTNKVFLILLLFLVFLPALQVAGQSSQQAVTAISIDGEITPAMASFLKSSIDHANRDGSIGIIIEISTLGGRVDAAVEMRDALFASEIPVAVYILDRAISAGSLISIAADQLIMAPGSHIGAAEPIPNEPKILAFVSGEFRTTAEQTGRDPVIAMAMVDASIEIEGLVSKGQILDLTANEAFKIGFADHIASGRAEVLKVLGWENSRVQEVQPDFRYQIAQFLTSYEVASILLVLGMIGLIAELFIPGFGVAGIAGIACFVLYFAGGFIAGNTELWSILVFAAGIVLLGIEIVAPGFGIFGIAGIIAVFTGVIFAAPTLSQGIGSLLIALAAAIAAVPVFLKIFGRARFVQRLVLKVAETTDLGYTHAAGKDDLLGKTGTALTVLRPSGSISVGGSRVDAITDGDFINQGDPVRVIRVEGSKVIVASADVGGN